MRDFPTKDILFGFGKVRDGIESERVLCGECALPEQVFEVPETVRPRELCTVIHKLLMGQTHERVGELGVDIRDRVVDVGLRRGDRMILLFFIPNGFRSRRTSLFVGAFGRHPRARREMRAKVAQRANACATELLSSMAFIWAEWTGIRLVGESTREPRCFAGASASRGAKRHAKLPLLDLCFGVSMTLIRPQDHIVSALLIERLSLTRLLYRFSLYSKFSTHMFRDLLGVVFLPKKYLFLNVLTDPGSQDWHPQPAAAGSPPTPKVTTTIRIIIKKKPEASSMLSGPHAGRTHLAVVQRRATRTIPGSSL